MEKNLIFLKNRKDAQNRVAHFSANWQLMMSIRKVSRYGYFWYRVYCLLFYKIVKWIGKHSLEHTYYMKNPRNQLFRFQNKYFALRILSRSRHNFVLINFFVNKYLLFVCPIFVNLIIISSHYNSDQMKKLFFIK